jgi:BMFP domain-containing protein YqiC
MSQYSQENARSSNASQPLDTLLNRLREALGDHLPGGPLTDRLQPVLEGFMEQFQLVPRREYDAHLATIARFERLIADLEARVADLERRDGA